MYRLNINSKNSNENDNNNFDNKDDIEKRKYFKK